MWNAKFRTCLHTYLLSTFMTEVSRIRMDLEAHKNFKNLRELKGMDNNFFIYPVPDILTKAYLKYHF
jgi:hypothetical protein